MPPKPTSSASKPVSKAASKPPSKKAQEKPKSTIVASKPKPTSKSTPKKPVDDGACSFLKMAEAIDEEDIPVIQTAIRNALPVLRYLRRESQRERQPEEFRRFYHQYTILLRSLGEVPVAWTTVTLPVEDADDEPFKPAQEYPAPEFKLPTALPPIIDCCLRQAPVDESDTVDANVALAPPAPTVQKQPKGKKQGKTPASGPVSQPFYIGLKRNLRSSQKSGEEQTDQAEQEGLKRKRATPKGKKKKDKTPEPSPTPETSNVEDGGVQGTEDEDEEVQPPKKTRKNAKGKKVRVGRTKVKNMDTRAFGREVGALAEQLAARKVKNRKAKDKSIQLTVDTGASAPFVTLVRQPTTGSRVIYSALAPKNILRGVPEDTDEREIPTISLEEVLELNVEDAIAPKFRCAYCALAGKECRVVGFGTVCSFCQSHGITRCSDHMSAEEILLAHRRLSSLYAISSDLYEVSFREALAAQHRAIELQELAPPFSLNYSIIDALGPNAFLKHFANDDQPDLIIDHFNSQVDTYNAMRRGTSYMPDEHQPARDWSDFTNGGFIGPPSELPIFSSALDNFVVAKSSPPSPEAGPSKKKRYEGHCIFRFNYGWEDFMTRPEFADNKMRWGLDLFPVADMAKHVPILLECNQLRHSRTVDLLHTRVRFVNSLVELLLLGRQWEAAGYSKEALDILADQRGYLRFHAGSALTGP
ncbi:hypothetical protein DFH06DRAFT_1148001 [Mycena polygramma]|nr:hypothetical protein DFH06DRAFT_1148001 [Mycena polygramma]